MGTTYRRFLPGQQDYDELLKLIRFYCTQPLAFDLTFVLGPGEAQPGRVGEEHWSQLGYDVWLAPEAASESRRALSRTWMNRAGIAAIPVCGEKIEQ